MVWLVWISCEEIIAPIQPSYMTALNIPSQPGGTQSRRTCDLEGNPTRAPRDGPDQIPGLEQGEFPAREPWIQEGGEKRVLISLKAPAPSSTGEGKEQRSRQKKSRDKEKVRDGSYGED